MTKGGKRNASKPFKSAVTESIALKSAVTESDARQPISVSYSDLNKAARVVVDHKSSRVEEIQTKKKGILSGILLRLLSQRDCYL